ncbi:hypothetical protein TRAPUB_10400, partial [Trametes pubescens]
DFNVLEVPLEASHLTAKNHSLRHYVCTTCPGSKSFKNKSDAKRHAGGKGHKARCTPNSTRGDHATGPAASTSAVVPSRSVSPSTTCNILSGSSEGSISSRSSSPSAYRPRHGSLHLLGPPSFQNTAPPAMMVPSGAPSDSSGGPRGIASSGNTYDTPDVYDHGEGDSWEPSDNEGPAEWADELFSDSTSEPEPSDSDSSGAESSGWDSAGGTSDEDRDSAWLSEYLRSCKEVRQGQSKNPWDPYPNATVRFPARPLYHHV